MRDSLLCTVVRNRALWALGLIFIFSSAAFATEVSVELKPHWKQGDKKRYEIVKKRKKVGAGKTIQEGTSRTDLEITVVKADATGFLLNWTMGETRFDEPRAGNDPVSKQAGNLLKGFPILLEVAPGGELRGVKNWKELKEKATEAVNAMVRIWRKSGLDEKDIDRTSAQVSSTFATKEKINQMCTREPHLYLFVLGRTFRTDKPITYDTLLPNPFGGDAFPAQGRLVLGSYDKGTGKAVVNWTQTIEPDAARRVLLQTLKKLAAQQGKEIKADQLPKQFKIEDSARFSVDVASGWILSLTQSRTIMTEAGSQVDSTAIIEKR